MSVITQPVDLRELAREWIASTLRTYLHQDLARGDRIRNIAAAIEEEAHEKNMPIELAVTMAADFAHEQNEEAGLSHASHY
jgi:hypothetical protein